MEAETQTVNLIDVYNSRRKELYEKDLEDGFIGSFDDWQKIQEEQYRKAKEKERLDYEEKKRIENLPENRIARTHSLHNPLLPYNWQNKTFENMKIEQRSRLEKIVDILKNQELADAGFWLSGGVGCGKTHILISMFNLISRKVLEEYKEIGSDVKYYNYSDLCGILRQDPNNFDRFQEIRSPHYLFIDDLGVSKTSDFIQEKIYSLFNYRVEQGLFTYVSTNLSLNEIQSEFNDRMVSRIKESSAWIEMSGIKDYRSNFIKDNMNKFKSLIE